MAAEAAEAELLRRREPLFLVLFLLLLSGAPTTFSDSTPATNYLLACGSSSPTSPPSSSDSRRFLPDLPSSHPSLKFSYDDSTSTSDGNSNSNSNRSLYSTARLFRRPSSYSFPLDPSTVGSTYFLRLHFLPFSNLSSARFSVSAAGILLLPNLTFTNNTSLLLKEFLLPNLTFTVSIPTLTLSFSPLPDSFAFINAIELFSSPSLFISIPSDSNKLLETIHRLNVGASKPDPVTDSLWRSWEDDLIFLSNTSLGANLATTTPISYFESGTSTREIAPDSIYQSARVMYLSSNQSITSAKRFNLTWNLPVTPGTTNLLRMHFCDIVGTSLNLFYFNAYIAGRSVERDIDFSSLATAYYKDFEVKIAGSSLLPVEIGPSDSTERPFVNAFLNGIEVMRITDGSLVFDTIDNSKKTTKAIIIAGVVAGCFVITLLLVFTVVVVFRWKKGEKQPEAEIRSPSHQLVAWSPLLAYTSGSTTAATADGASISPGLNIGLKIPLLDLRSVTNNFDLSYQIGAGGFGRVYRGSLPDGSSVAVKRATPGSRQGLPEFLNEITLLSKIRHRHLVSLIGYCDEQGEMILVYEFMSKGTLRDHLYNSENPPLSWKQRLEVCIGAARGLHYLHTGDSQSIIHRDVKSANILLDENYLAKVADFGLSKLGPPVDQTHVSTGVKGSFGYLDPEYFKTRQLTEKSDVYSFGVVLLEVACARPAIDPSLPYDQVNLADWGIKWQKRGMLRQIVDPVIGDDITPGSLRKFGETAERCLASYGVDRPSMADVLWNLDYALKLQDTALDREPYDDSITNPSAVPAVNIGRYPSIGPNGQSSRSPITDASFEFGDSQVFSQIVSSQGR